MSLRAVVVVWVIAVLLVGAVVLSGPADGGASALGSDADPGGVASNGPGGTAAETMSLRVDPASIAGVVSTSDDGREVSVTRDRFARDVWIVQVASEGVARGRWIARDGFVANGLRGLATASLRVLDEGSDDALGEKFDRSRGVTGDVASLEGGGFTLDITDDRGVTSVAVGAGAIAGRRVASVDGPAAFAGEAGPAERAGAGRGVLIDMQVAEALTPDGLLRWTEPAPFFRVGTGPTSVRVDRPGREPKMLTRRLGRWETGRGDRVDRDRVVGWLTLLGSVEAEEIAGHTDAREDGFDEGVATVITASTPISGPAGGRARVVQRLALDGELRVAAMTASIEPEGSRAAVPDELVIGAVFNAEAVASVLVGFDRLIGGP
ncbi:MAG: hypothetical protein AAF235_05705 [Planctomycetota bacterium]